MTAAVVLFALAAVGGIILAVIRFRGQPYPPLGLFVLAFVLRGGASEAPGVLVLGLEVLGALGLVVTGWLGGHLVFGHGAGVNVR